MNILKKLTAFTLALTLSLSPAALAQKTYPLRPAAETMPEKVTLPTEAFEPDGDWSAQNPAVKSTKLAGVYDQRLDRCQYLTVAEVEGCEDVPYVSVREYLSGLFANTVTFQMQEDKKAFIINRNGVNAVIDLENPSIRCDAWEWFMGQAKLDGYPEGFVQPNEFVNLRHSLFEWETGGNDSFTISLDYEGIRPVVLDRDVLMPFLALQNSFAVQILEKELFPVYNGDNFYTTGDGFEWKAPEEMTPYEKAYFSGRFCRMERPSQAYVQYNYACICLMFDHFFGHKEQMGITSFDAWFEEWGLKEDLLSTDPLTYRNQLSTLVYMLFDSGHDSVNTGAGLFGTAIQVETTEEIAEQVIPELTEEERVKSYMARMGAESAKLFEATYYMYKRIPAELKNEETGRPKPTVIFEEDTAFLFFYHFDENLTRESFYTAPPTEEDESTSTFAFFYNAFEQIKARPEIRNVVLDLSANVGGAGAVVALILGFLSPDGKAEISYLNTAGDNSKTEYYHVDTNLDGEFNEEDGFGGQYDFYMLTSPASYSCANGLPYYAQEQGLARVIGEKPGGGDCCVFAMMDGFGLVSRFSGYLKIGRLQDGVFVSAEKDVAVDLSFEGEDLYFDYPAIVNRIHEYKEG